ncbi:MaoC family dehydratase [Brevibacterium sp. FAM 24630]|uniref:MaoC family dehydratase n=1 Tax=unclassified Brevibacterium TaxID=2614124 RepID=UPI003C79CCDC
MMADSMLPVYARAVLKTLPVGSRTSPELPQRSIDRSVPLEPVAYAGFAHVVEQRLYDVVHPGYLHVLGFPLSMQLLSDPEVPLPMLGMVHIHNRVDVLSPARLGEVVDFHVELAGPFEHAKGTTIEVHVTAQVEGRPVMDEVSTYLAKGKKLPGARARAQVPHAEFTAPQPSALWRLDPIIGQRYAQVSGDFNPIHLNGLAAKGFGFSRQIAHGMYTASRALSAMDPRLESYRWDVSFAKPILLPGTAGYALTDGRRHGASRSAVFDPKSGKPHVLTQVAHLEG